MSVPIHVEKKGAIRAMENTFDMAYNSCSSWTSEQCGRMMDVLRRRLADDQEAALKAAGLFDSDALFQPIPEEQFRQELLSAQDAYMQGDYADALAFCDEMERQKA